MEDSDRRAADLQVFLYLVVEAHLSSNELHEQIYERKVSFVTTHVRPSTQLASTAVLATASTTTRERWSHNSVSAQTHPLDTPRVLQSPRFAAPPRIPTRAFSEDFGSEQGFGLDKQRRIKATTFSQLLTHRPDGGSVYSGSGQVCAWAPPFRSSYHIYNSTEFKDCNAAEKQHSRVRGDRNQFALPTRRISPSTEHRAACSGLHLLLSLPRRLAATGEGIHQSPACVINGRAAGHGYETWGSPQSSPAAATTIRLKTALICTRVSRLACFAELIPDLFSPELRPGDLWRLIRSNSPAQADVIRQDGQRRARKYKKSHEAKSESITKKRAEASRSEDEYAEHLRWLQSGQLDDWGIRNMPRRS